MKLILTLLTLITIVNCEKFSCNFIKRCDCKPTYNVYSDVYNLNCPSQDNRTKDYKLDVEFFISSHNSRVTIDCKNDLSNLNSLPGVESPLLKFRQLNFINCFNNGTENSNYIFNLDRLINQLNITLHDRTFHLVVNNFSMISDGNEFFINFHLQNFYLILIKNLGFNSKENFFLQSITNSTQLIFNNNNHIDFNSFAVNSVLIILEIENNKIDNFNKINLNKFRSLSKLELTSCVLDVNDLNVENLFEYNSYINELFLKNITTNGAGVTLHENLLFGLKKMRILTITGLELNTVHVNLFSELTTLITLDLSNNNLSNLEMDTFKFNMNLQYLNLSSNYFMSFDGYQIFQQIKSLRKLHLDNNLLTKFYYNASGQNYFNELHLHNNQLSYDEEDSCPFSNITARIKINLSWNKIINVSPLMDCFVEIQGLSELNLENNLITEVELKPLTTSSIVLERLFDTLLLASNNITSIDVLDEVDWETFVGEYKKTNLIVDLDLNPLFCSNCDLLKQIFNHSYVPITSEYGTVIRFQHPKKCKTSAFCDEQIFYDHDYKCPLSCSCLYNEFSQTILIECMDKELTNFPIIDYSRMIAVKSFILNFQNNKIKEFSTKNQNPEVFKRLKTINLENNMIESFNLSLLYNNVDEIFLKNNRLRITNDFIKQLNDREILLPELKVTLSGNLYCDDFSSEADLFSTIHFKIVDRDLITCVSNNTEDATAGASSNSKNTSQSKIWIIPVFLIILAIVGGYVYYRSKGEIRTPRFINRLRYRKANVEFESNLIQDDS